MTEATTTQSNGSKSQSKGKPAITNKGADIKANFKAPEGFTDQSQDIVGFWDMEIEPAIQFIPNEAVLMDSDLDETKYSVLIFGTLVAPCKLKQDSKSGNIIDGKKGDVIGIWGKPGMRALRNLQGVHVVLYPDGVKATGKPNPMTVFKVLAKEKGGHLPVVDDRRDKSASQETWLDIKKGGPAAF